MQEKVSFYYSNWQIGASHDRTLTSRVFCCISPSNTMLVNFNSKNQFNLLVFNYFLALFALFANLVYTFDLKEFNWTLSRHTETTFIALITKSKNSLCIHLTFHLRTTPAQEQPSERADPSGARMKATWKVFHVESKRSIGNRNTSKTTCKLNATTTT